MPEDTKPSGLRGEALELAIAQKIGRRNALAEANRNDAKQIERRAAEIERIEAELVPMRDAVKNGVAYVPAATAPNNPA